MDAAPADSSGMRSVSAGGASWAARRVRAAAGPRVRVEPVQVVDGRWGAGVVVDPVVSRGLAGDPQWYARWGALLRGMFSCDELSSVSVLLSGVDVESSGSFRRSVLLRVWGSVGDVLSCPSPRGSGTLAELMTREQLRQLCGSEESADLAMLWLSVCQESGCPPQGSPGECEEFLRRLVSAPVEVRETAEVLAGQWYDSPERWVEASFALCRTDFASV